MIAGVLERAARSLLRLPALFFWVGWVAAAPAAAQEPQDTTARDTLPLDTVYVEEIKVTVARPVTTAGGAAAVAVALDSVRSGPSPTLAEVLRDLPLIQVRENSRGEVQPSVRGMESRRVAVLVDGVPITLGWDARTDLSVVPLTAARRLTLVRGLSSVLYGPNALGGAVLVEIGEGEGRILGPTPLQMSAGVDDEGNNAVALGLSTLVETNSGELLLRGGGGYRKRSHWPAPSGVSIPGGASTILNSDLEHGNGYVSARYQTDGGAWYALSSFGFVAEKGVPPELHVAEPRLWRYPNTWRWVTALSAGTGWKETPWGEGDLEASIGIDFGETEIDTYETLAYDSITGGERGDDRTLSLRLLADHSLGAGILRSALTLAESRHIEIIDDGDPNRYRQRFLSFGLEAEQPIMSDADGRRARLSVGFSVDGSDTPETGPAEPRDAIWAWGARAGGTLVLARGDLLLNGGVSRRVRFPALRELYSGALGRFVVNPTLDPEVLAVAELGATFRFGALEAQTVTFYQRLSDAIVRVSLGDGRLQRQNRDRITSAGLEVLLDLTVGRASITGNTTIQNVDLTDPTAPQEQRRPEYQPWFIGGVGTSLRLGNGFWTAVNLEHMAPQFCVHPDLGREVRLAASTWLDLQLGKTLIVGGRRSEATLAVNNVTDSSVFDQCGLPQPGRVFRLQLRLF
ncbi:MAG: TonB-dependent receptor [Gemmatimonadetes bacterium]|uniref:TonB-dependent receptor n=1 Tax=Candidatus Kutchimonas denitrificans TaxID=3056748 RepID=A0AAE4Z934_9BACT|nr:TonB-dependent receptor [Gemmatimonadota bacterium]NIR76089.1 TonB-dependent receptor [Candidatus Kutchimonas denitrificans]NIS00468.1 TonB-dependent receptor [Gemmatimonadota bacterium]NIT66126.1 TonB-dependent receptor [Gemmatimonadota bacterium]NIV22694.1 TonB-dependent receptor [Gemmatimonadota bacterium]